MPIDFAYAQARAQAELGERLTPSRWRAVESSADLGRYLHALRGTMLAPSVQHLTAGAAPHTIERTLRGAWRDRVARSRQWVPRQWAAAVEWAAWLPDLDAIGFLLDNHEPPAWMQDDPSLARFALLDIADRREAVESTLGPLPPAKPFDVGRWWYEQWRDRIPPGSANGRWLDELASLVDGYLSRLAGTRSTPTSAAEPGEQFEQRVTRLLHRRAGSPASVFCHLTLAALDLVRLRGGLVSRSLVNVDLAGARS